MEKIQIKEGFTYKGFKFGWIEEKLYRLPITKHDREYSMREVPVIKITKKIKGYRLVRDKKSLSQVTVMTKKMSVKINAKHCPKCKQS